MAIAVDGSGQVYVSLFLGSQISVFDADGHLLRTIATISQHLYALALAADGSCYALTENGVEVHDPSGQYVRNEAILAGSHVPQDIAVDELGNLYVAVASTAGLFRFDPAGGFLAEWDNVIQHDPGGIVASNGSVVIGSQSDGRLVELTTGGQPVWSIALPAPCNPIDVARDRDSGYYVLDFTGQRVLHLSQPPVPARAASWGEVKGRYR